MNLDQRLEALTRSAEKHDSQLEALLQSAAQRDAQIGTLGTKFGKLEELVTGIAEGTTRLLRIVEMHEHRLDSHDDRLDNMENT